MDVHVPQAAFTFQFGTQSNAKRRFAFAPAITPPPDLFSRLFPDVALLVFEELARLDRPDPQSLGWMRAAQVNRRWRATILDMPRLWARDFLARGYKRGFRLFVPLTQESPLTLDLQLPREVPDAQRLRELLPRTKSLLRSGSDKAISQTLEELCISPLPLLEEVILSCREQEVVPFYLRDYLSMHPKLRTVSVHGCYLPIPSQVTSLTVSLRGWENLSNATNLGMLLDTLEHTPRLQTLNLHFQEFARGISPIRHDDRKIHLPALTNLLLNDPSVQTGEVVAAFLKHLDMPSLTRVHVTQAYKYGIMNGGPALRRHDAAREFQDLLSYFGSAPCARDPTYLCIESRTLYKPDLKGVWDDAHIMAIHLSTHPPTHPSPSFTWPEGSRSLSLRVCYKHNPRWGFPVTISRALQTTNIPLRWIAVLDVDISPFVGLSVSIERLLIQCHNVRRLIVGRQNEHESAHAILQALTPSIPGDANPFRQLPMHIESQVLLPHLRTVELPTGNIDRIHFVELLAARYARGAPLRHFIIPGEELEKRISMTMRGLSGLVRGQVIARLCAFAASVGATVDIIDPSPKGKSGTCPTEILFNYTPPPCIYLPPPHDVQKVSS